MKTVSAVLEYLVEFESLVVAFRGVIPREKKRRIKMNRGFKRLVSGVSLIMALILACNTTMLGVEAKTIYSADISRKVLVSDSRAVTANKRISFKNKKESIKSGSKKQLKLICHPGERPYSLSFKSKNSKIASVDSFGNVSAKKSGSTVISVKAVFKVEVKDSKAVVTGPAIVKEKKITRNTSVKVTVKPDYKKISVSRKQLNLETRSSGKLGITYKSKNKYAVTPKLTFKSQNTKIATVSKKGEVTGVSEGKTKIVISSRDGQKLNVNVRVKNPSMKKTIYLTFDDGPGSVTTPKLLSVLKKYNAQATFFVVGRYANANKGIVKKAYKQGNTIAVHTYTHEYRQIYASTNAYMSDLNKTAKLVKDITGEYPTYFRFPGGGNNHYSNARLRSTVLKKAHAEGFTAMDWNAATNDAMGISYSADQMTNFGISSINACIKRGKAPVVLIHDSNAKRYTPYEVEHIIKYFSKRGYKFKGLKDYYGDEICFSY